MSLKRLALTIGLAAMWMLVPAASALATDRYVDNDSMGLPPCTNPAFPCSTIVQATGVPSVAGDVIHVGGGTYAGNLTLPNGVSLIKDSFTSPFDTSGPATIGAGTDTTPAITLATGVSPRTISGFTIRGGNLPTVSTIDSAGTTDNVTIAGNTFDAHPPLPAPANSTRTDVRLSGGSPRVTGNTFIGPNPHDDARRIGISYNGAGSNVEIGNNSFDRYMLAISLNGSPTTAIANVHDNTAIDLYDDQDLGLEEGIIDTNVAGSLTRNLLIELPGQVSGNGLLLANGTGGTALIVSDNRVFGFQSYSQIGGTNPVVLTNDVFSNDGEALFLLNSPSVTATNVTATNSTAGAGFDIRVQDASLTLNSSVVGSQGVDSAIGGSCASSFSFRTGGVQTCGLGSVANPMFASPATNDFHLLAGSPLIDAGDPATPSEATDLDGNARAIPILGCPARRDVGAYEFAINPLDCTPPPAPATTAPDTTVSGKRKIKTRKRKVRVTWTFASPTPGATFACSLDGAPFAPCTSPFTKKLRRGAHTLAVRASDAAGNLNPTPAAFTTKVKRKH
jgi:hypothetical protein